MAKRQLVIPFMVLAFVMSACGFSVNVDFDQGSGVVRTENRQVSGFDRVSLNGIGDVTLVQGDSESLQIEAEDNVIKNITTEVRDGTLHIGFERKTVLPTKPVKFYLTMKTIHGLESRGVSNINAESVQTDQLDISISGTGNIEIENLKASRLKINTSGAGNFTSAGEIDQQEINLSGAGSFNGEDLQSKTAEVTITGLGKVTVWVTEKLEVTISGTGGVDFYGDPQVSQHISGLGKLTHRGSK